MAKELSWDRKHRPLVLDDLCGHPQAVNQLTQIIRNADKTLPNAVMFHGGSGRGKTTMARILARYLNCEKGSSCGKCKSCNLMDRDNHPDYKEYNAAENRGINEIRAINAQSKFKPRHKLRIIFLDECHMLTKEAANALLKPLEEPPEDTLWILGTTNPEMIPNTKAICGRCAQFNLGEPHPKHVAQRLGDIAKLEGINKVVPESALMELAQASGGHIRDAVKMLEALNNLIQMEKNPKKVKEKDVMKLVDGVTTKVNSDDVELEKIAIKILAGIYAGDASMIIQAVMDTKDYVPLAMKMMFLNKYIMFNAAGCSNGKFVWHTPANKLALSVIQKNNKAVLKSPHATVLVQKAITDIRHALVTTAGVDGSDIFITRAATLELNLDKKKKK
ncbi:holliday junction ATP-dependent DNA helicase [Vibrio phage vB_VcorM_GR11A]|nr:holliday junction ATP-dependent DNA helicase [Vibrio phage vB_VcorM_GR11A]